MSRQQRGWRRGQSVLVLASIMASTAWSDSPKIGAAWQGRRLERPSSQNKYMWRSHQALGQKEVLYGAAFSENEETRPKEGLRQKFLSSLGRHGGGAGLSATTNIQVLHLVVSYLAYCAVYLARKPVSVVKPMLASDLGLSTSALAIVDTAWLGLYAVGQLSLGLTRSMISSQTLLLVAFLVSGLTTFLCSTAHAVQSLALFWGLNGLFQASINPLLVLHVAEILPASARATGVGIWQTSQQVGGVCANLFAAHTLRTSGWRAIFASSGAVVALAGLPVFWLVANKEKLFRKGSTSSSIPSSPIRSSKRQKYNSPPPFALAGVKPTCTAYFFVKLTRYCLMFWLPLFLVRAAGYQVENAARISALLDLGGVLGSVLAGLVADRIFKGAMLSTCAPFAFATSLCLILLAFAYDKGPSLKNALLLFSAGFFVAAPDGVLGGAAAKNIADYNGNEDPKLPAAISGLINGCGSIGVRSFFSSFFLKVLQAIAQGIGTAALVDAAGWSSLFFCLAAFMGLASVALTPAIRLEQSYLAQQQSKSSGLPR